MPENRWKRKARALARLAEDQRGKPEGDAAWEKLQQIIDAHPEAALYGPVIELIQREVEWMMTGAHLVEMKKAGVNLDGSWSGESLGDAIHTMVADYRRRYDARLGKVLEDRRAIQQSQLSD